MAGCGKNRGDENDSGAGPAGANDFGNAVRRGRHEARQAQVIRPAPGAQMDTGTQACGQPRIAGDDKGHAARFTEFGGPGREGGAIGRVIMPEDHTRGAARQAGDGRQRVRHPQRVSEIPEDRKFVVPPLLYRAAPGQ